MLTPERESAKFRALPVQQLSAKVEISKKAKYRKRRKADGISKFMYPKPAKEQKPTSVKPKQLTVSVLGRHMKISCPAGQEEKLQAAMLELEQRVSKTKYQPGVHGAEDVLLMIALNLCNELLETKKND